eukprot:gnl/TRDRNA2_/TRDRNA2_173697_c19_seq1.p2 gnl/TRDRNA2_/TRDRNA2_173697_c19~~gnl/TRDRNA2_/TRDRNA2_173697_c19_seq1.p2  ORF type:complete len:144 (-),score=3.95 gnl/TRDRNA2_/TRDRNA2_173697_c19_seq1:6-437(-)
MFGILMKAAEHRVNDFDVQDLGMTLWISLRHESLTDTWILFRNPKLLGVSFDPLCSGLVLMECEQRELRQHELALLRDLERVPGNGGAKATAFQRAVKIVAAMHLRRNWTGTRVSQIDAAASHEEGNVQLGCVWCIYSRHDSP